MNKSIFSNTKNIYICLISLVLLQLINVAFDLALLFANSIEFVSTMSHIKMITFALFSLLLVIIYSVRGKSLLNESIPVKLCVISETILAVVLFALPVLYKSSESYTSLVISSVNFFICLFIGISFCLSKNDNFTLIAFFLMIFAYFAVAFLPDQIEIGNIYISDYDKNTLYMNLQVVLVNIFSLLECSVILARCKNISRKK